tara:strand:- start:902 stop:1588 length:687 start_codon:yes stop_codon:yes gene_type:complete
MKIKIIDAVILAAGSGKRFQQKIPKQFNKINGTSLIDIAVLKLSSIKNIRNIYLAINKSHHKYTKLIKTNPNIIYGGRTRTESVFNALNYLNSQNIPPDNILIHDAARPCVHLNDIKKIVSKSNSISNGISLGFPLTNALKNINKNMYVMNNIEKKNLWVSFTPQIFNFKKLYKSYQLIRKLNKQVDDEIEAMSISSFRTKLLFTSCDNIKITYPNDMILAKNIMRHI